jgi:hypothetical protein
VIEAEQVVLYEMVHFCYNPSRIELMDVQMLEKMRELNSVYKITGLSDIIDRKYSFIEFSFVMLQD